MDKPQYATARVERIYVADSHSSPVSNGESGTLSSSSAPLFVSLFPERDRNCHLMVHNNSDNGMFRTPLGYRAGLPLNRLMTLQNFIDGGYDVLDAKILVVVKSIGAKRKGEPSEHNWTSRKTAVRILGRHQLMLFESKLMLFDSDTQRREHSREHQPAGL